MLLFSVVFSSFAVADTILTQGFESGIMPPSGWSVVNQNNYKPWTIMDASQEPDLVYEGNYGAYVGYDDDHYSDNWLKSSNINLDGYSSATLSFWCKSDTEWAGATLKLHISGDGFDDVIWDMIQDETWTTFIWRQKTFNLDAYTYETIKISWQYVGIHGNCFCLDSIVLSGTPGSPNNPPYAPSNPNPSDGETNIDIMPTLSWIGGDPDGDPVKYDVYLGTENPPPKVANDITQESYEPDMLYYQTVYYWQIISQDNRGGVTPSPVWSFTTEVAPPNVPPYTPSNPNPENGEENVVAFTEFNWTGGDENPWDVVTYDLYLGFTSSPSLIVNNISQTSYYHGVLDFNTTYYWKIVAWDNHGASSEGPLWNFTTRISLIGDTLHVGGTGPDNYTDIQEAIDDAEDYDVVFIHNDSSPYSTFLLNIHSSIYLIGEDAETTVVGHWQGIKSIFYITSSNVTISNITVFGGNYGIYFSSAYQTAHCSLSNLIFVDQYAANNIYFGNTCNTTVSYCTFSEGKTVRLNTENNHNAFYRNIFSDTILEIYGFENYFFENEMTDVTFKTIDSIFYHNNIYSYSTVFTANTLFDNGYPSGGNYWVGYTGDDEFHGSSQTVPGKDNIIDEPYEYCNFRFDYYPLKYPWGTLPPLARYSYSIEGANVLFNASESYDMDGVLISFIWDFGDGSPTLGGNVISHTYNESGTYNVTLTVIDNDGYSDICWHLVIVDIPNFSPSAPSITGPVSGDAGEIYEYTFISIDPDGDDIYYYIQWGDGTDTLWLGPFDSGEVYIHDHAWSEGTYTIRAKAKDSHGHESGWGTLEVTMPLNYVIQPIVASEMTVTSPHSLEVGK